MWNIRRVRSALRWFIWPIMISLPTSESARYPFGRQSPAFAAPPSSGRTQGHDTIAGQPSYKIASVDLSQKWVDLVRQGKVTATVQIPQDDTDGSEMISVKYGVRLVAKRDQTLVCEEFVQEAGLEQGRDNLESKLVRSINETLKSFQNDEKTCCGSPTVKFVLDGNFAAQLQLVRTLRPAPSPGFSGSTTAVPPPYNSETDSFVTGPLRLELRPRVGSLFQTGMKNSWDVFHNVSPADTRGHFLLLPTLADESNWRGQLFTSDDCNDMVYLTSSIEPVGSLFLGYNSVGAGASQNHIHCHAWPSPPLPLQTRPSLSTDRDDIVEGGLTSSGWECYAVSRLDSMYDICDVMDGMVEVSYLKYPVFCVQLSASCENLHILSQALAATLDAVGDAPHNVGFLNRWQHLSINEDDDDEEEEEHEVENEEPQKFTDVYVFARSKERSTVLPLLKLGISEMMGVFHAQSDRELEILSEKTIEDEGPMFQALSDISFLDEEALWESIKNNLQRIG